MAQKKTDKRRTKVKDLDVKNKKLSTKETKKIKGGLTQGGGPMATQNQKIQELTFN